MSMDLSLHRVANIFVGEPKELTSTANGQQFRFQQLTVVDADGARHSITLYLGEACKALPANLLETFLHPMATV